MKKNESLRKWIYKGIDIKSPEFEKTFALVAERNINEFNSIEQWKKRFSEFNLLNYIKGESFSIEGFKSMFEKKFLPFLFIPKLTQTNGKENKFYRVIKDTDEKFFSEKSKFYSNPNVPYSGRFNNEGERILYISDCIITAVNECYLNEHKSKCFVIIEYELKEDILISSFSYNNDSYSEYINLTMKFYNNIFSASSVGLDVDKKKKLYQVTNYFKEKFLSNKDLPIKDGYYLQSYKSYCQNEECFNQNIGIDYDHEEKLNPIRVHVYKSGRLNKSLNVKNFKIIT